MNCPYHPDAEVTRETFTDDLPDHVNATWTDYRCDECDYLIKRTRA